MRQRQGIAQKGVRAIEEMAKVLPKTSVRTHGLSPEHYTLGLADCRRYRSSLFDLFFTRDPIVLRTLRILAEILATWNRTPKQEFQKTAGGCAGTGAGKNGGAGQSAGTGAGRSCCLWFIIKGPACQHLCQHPPFCQHLCPPALFWNSCFGVLYQVARILRSLADTSGKCF